MNIRFLCNKLINNNGYRFFYLAVVVLITTCTLVICICSVLIVSSLSSASILLGSTKCSHKVGNSKIIPTNQNLSCIEESIINETRMRNAFEMNQSGYTNEMNRLTALTPATDGRPIRSMVLSTWRSGSSFLGGVISAISGSFYYFEPLYHLASDQIRTPGELANEATETIHQLLKCNYTGLEKYLNSDDHLNENNRRLRTYCEAFHFLKLCKHPSFMSSFCSIFPFQVIKTVRFRAALAEPLLSNLDLNIQIVLLIRDPRGIISSRNREEWCGTECRNTTGLCQDLVSDFKAARYLTKKYPTRFKIVRYEDLTLDVFKVVEQILLFYGLPFHVDVIRYLDTHTNGKRTVDTQFLTRDTKNAAFSWRQRLTFAEIERVQSECSEALDSWGYQKISSEDELKSDTFHPLLPLRYN